MVTREEIERITKLAKYYNVKNFTVDTNGKVNVSGNVRFIDYKIFNGEIPIPFGRVSGDFICIDSGLTSLVNCPKRVGGDFNIKINNLTTLKHCPEYIGGNFNCSANKLDSLRYITEIIHGDLDCSLNLISTLKYMPFKAKSVDMFMNRITDVYNPMDVNVGLVNINIASLPYGLNEIIFYSDENEDSKLNFGTFLRYQNSYGIWNIVNGKPVMDIKILNELIQDIQDGLE